MLAQPRAPKLHAFLTRRERIFVMDRAVWRRAKPPQSERILFDLDGTPLAGVGDKGVYATAAPSGDGVDYRISIYRPDPKDIQHGAPINTDHYRVFERFPSHLDLHRTANIASTYVDENLLAYIDERVFLVKEPRGDDHWLPDYPTQVILMVEASRRR
jgi:hypothetical protein